MSLAVVFDSAGTLMKTVRAVFSTKTKTISHGEETTLLVFEDADRMLVLLQAGSADIFSCSADVPLSAWIADAGIRYAVSCGNASTEDAARILQQDTVTTVGNLQETADACRSEAEHEAEQFAMNTGLILNSRLNTIEFIVAAAGYPFEGVKELMQNLQEAGAEVFVASGDRQEKLEAVAEFIGIPKNHVFGAATPERKAEVVCNLQNTFDTVIMTGDGINDMAAFRQADYAVLTVQQWGRRPDILFSAVDEEIENIREVEKIARRFV